MKKKRRKNITFNLNFLRVFYSLYFDTLNGGTQYGRYRFGFTVKSENVPETLTRAVVSDAWVNTMSMLASVQVSSHIGELLVGL